MKSKARKIMQYTADILISFSIFFLILSFLPKTQTTETLVQDEEIKFVFHASASQRDMFFAENELEDVLSGELKGDLIEFLDKEFSSEPIEEDTEEIPDQKNMWECELPRVGYKIKHGESVLAYQQRTDVSSICNIERRTCEYGVLDGSYQQRSCKEIIKYTYTKEDVVTYNSRPTNLYIQPPELAPNRNEEFSMEGKVNEELIPIDYRDNSINNPVITENPDIGQVIITKKSCTTPRGETVKHSHFVKAYKSNLGFSNNLCDVELRMCLDGELEGNFQYPYCEHHDVPDEEYLINELEQANSEDNEFNIWSIVEGLF